MDARAIIDDALEITIVASFSDIGYRIRRRLFRWQPPPAGALEGRTVLITGPTSGLGRSAADDAAALGARVILVGRSRDRLAEVRDELAERHGEDRYPLVEADLSSLGSVRSAAGRILAEEPRLDVIVDSAGAIMDERTVTDDGIEATFATMVVGPFVLIASLLPLLSASDDGRVISVVSGGMYAQPLALDDLQSEEGGFDGTRAYARAKRAQATMAREWARRLPASRPRVNAMHPGWVDTPGLEHALPTFYRIMEPVLRTPQEGADTITWLAAEPAAGARGGRLFLDRRPRPFDRVPATRLDASERRQLWDRVVELARIPDPAPAR